MCPCISFTKDHSSLRKLSGIQERSDHGRWRHFLHKLCYLVEKLLLVPAKYCSLFPCNDLLFLSSCPIQVQRENFSYANNMHLAALQLPLILLKITVVAVLL